MILDISKGKCDESVSTKFTFEFKPRQELILNQPYIIMGDAMVSGSYMFEGEDDIVIKGNIRLPLRFICSKCGSAFEDNLFIEFDERFVRGESEDYYSYDSSLIELLPMIESAIMLNIPSYVVCGKNCKGLCSHCGANLNFTKCDCEKSKIGKNNPFAELKGKLD
ncbi:MAG: DUF177 domain-containing protein [Clostridia bacterium]